MNERIKTLRDWAGALKRIGWERAAADLSATADEMERLLRIEEAAVKWHDIASGKAPVSIVKFQKGLDAYNGLTAALEDSL